MSSPEPRLPVRAALCRHDIDRRTSAPPDAARLLRARGFSRSPRDWVTILASRVFRRTRRSDLVMAQHGNGYRDAALTPPCVLIFQAQLELFRIGLAGEVRHIGDPTRNGSLPGARAETGQRYETRGDASIGTKRLNADGAPWAAFREMPCFTAFSTIGFFFLKENSARNCAGKQFAGVRPQRPQAHRQIAPSECQDIFAVNQAHRPAGTCCRSESSRRAVEKDTREACKNVHAASVSFFAHQAGNGIESLKESAVQLLRKGIKLCV